MPETSPTEPGPNDKTLSDRLFELQAENARVCGLCGQPDMNACLSNDEWTAITGIPAGEPGLRCIHCIDRLAKEKGLTYTVYFFWNGEAGKSAPYEPENPEWEKFRDEEWQRQIGLVQAQLAAAREETAEYAEAIREYIAACHHSGHNYAGNYTWAYHGGNETRYTPARENLRDLVANPPNGESALKQLAERDLRILRLETELGIAKAADAFADAFIEAQRDDALKRATKLEAALEEIRRITKSVPGSVGLHVYQLAGAALAETAPEEPK